MSKISFTNLKLKTNKEIKEIVFNDSTIEVLQYLPISEKYDLAMITLQKSKENNYYNPIKMEMFFNLNLVYSYSNITFTEKQKADEAKLYDALESSGLLAAIINAIPKEEYDNIYYFLDTLETKMDKVEKSIAAKLTEFIEILPSKMEAAAEIAQNFDPNQFGEVMKFITAANGGRVPTGKD